MAQPIHCAVDPTHGEADWLVTARSEATGWEPGTTHGFCDGCLMGLMLARAQEIMGAAEPQPDNEPEGPGALESVEADEGPAPVAPVNGRSRKSRTPPPERPEPVAISEAEASDE